MPATSRFWNENKAVFVAENFDFCTEREVICKYCQRNSFFGLRFDPESQEEFTIADLEQNFYAKTTLGTRAMICCYTVLHRQQKQIGCLLFRESSLFARRPCSITKEQGNGHNDVPVFTERHDDCLHLDSSTDFGLFVISHGATRVFTRAINKLH